MKAVYETPRVSFEAFAANNAVSACRGSFDCVLGDGKNMPWEDYDNHGKEDQPDFTRVLASSVGFNNCSTQAGFADYVNYGAGDNSANDTETTDDNITNWYVNGPYGMDVSDAYSERNARKDSFMGWLYISLTGNGYSTDGWGFVKTRYGKKLDFKPNTSIWHAWLAPVFRTKATSV